MRLMQSKLRAIHPQKVHPQKGPRRSNRTWLCTAVGEVSLTAAVSTWPSAGRTAGAKDRRRSRSGGESRCWRSNSQWRVPGSSWTWVSWRFNYVFSGLQTRAPGQEVLGRCWRILKLLEFAFTSLHETPSPSPSSPKPLPSPSILEPAPPPHPISPCRTADDPHLDHALDVVQANLGHLLHHLLVWSPCSGPVRSVTRRWKMPQLAWGHASVE